MTTTKGRGSASGWTVHGWASAVALGVLLMWGSATAARALEAEERTGVVVEEVGEGSALAEAGLEPGDVLLSWERLPNPPANPNAARGELASPFDWLWLRQEQAPRGTVKLWGEREGEEIVSKVAPGQWSGRVRPRMKGAILQVYLKGKVQLAAGDQQEATDAWQEVVERSELSGSVRCWMLQSIGEAWARVGEWGRAHTSFGFSLEQAASPAAQVAVWNSIGSTFVEQKQFEKAGEAYVAAQEVVERNWGENTLHVGRSLNALGSVTFEIGDLKRASQYLTRALRITEPIAPDSLDLARVFYNLGRVAWARHEVERANEYYARALGISEKLAPDGIDLARIVNNLGLVAMARGELDRADGHLARALNLKEKLVPDSLSLANTLTNVGLLAAARSELDRAEDFYAQALDLAEKLAPDSLRLARILNNIGSVARLRGELDGAEDYYTRALIITERLAPRSLSLAGILNDLGVVAMLRGNLDRAEEYYTRLMNLTEELYPDDIHLAASLNNLGLVAADLGELDRADYYYTRALKITEKLAPDSLDLAAGLNSLGTVASVRGELDRANEYYRRALSIKERLAPGSLYVAMTLNDLGDLAKVRSELDQAGQWYTRALKITEKVAPNSLHVAGTLHHLGDLARTRGELDQAREYYTLALKIREKLAPGSSVEAEALHALGTVYRQQGDLEAAVGLFSRAVVALEGQVSRLGTSRDGEARFRGRRASYYRHHIEVLLELKRSEQAFYTLERSRGQGFLAQLAERDLVFADLPERLERDRRHLAVSYNRTLQELAEHTVSEDEARVDALRRELRQLRGKRDDLEVQIRRASPRLGALQYPQALTFEATQQALDPGTVMLSYSVGEEQTDLFVVTHEGQLQVVTLHISEEQLQEQVREFLHLVRNVRHERPEIVALHKIGEYLYRVLVEPAEGRIEENTRVLIVPDGPLHALPFGALVRKLEAHDADPDRDWQYLAEWKALHSVLSATVYSELKKSPQPDVTAGGTSPLTLVAFGDPVYPQDLGGQGRSVDVDIRAATERGYDFRPLDYSRKEVLRIAGQYSPEEVRTYLGAEATEERVKTVNPGTRILHFATHARFNDAMPLDSFLAFTIADKLDERRDNGLLHTWEIFESVRIDADLVVLSACETGLGKEQWGEGLISLSRAFQYAGARSVVASQWRVHDQATAELMVRFHRYLRAGESKDEALRAAQLMLISHPIQVEMGGRTRPQDVSLPYYWAAFQIMGDWR